MALLISVRILRFRLADMIEVNSEAERLSQFVVDQIHDVAHKRLSAMNFNRTSHNQRQRYFHLSCKTQLFFSNAIGLATPKKK